MKKLTLVLFTLLTLLPLGSWADDYVINGITFSYTSGSEATIKSVDGSATNAEIPTQINVGTTDEPQEVNITAIEATAFSSCVNLKTLTIGKNVATIPEGSFKNCSNLTSFSVADGNANFKAVDDVLFSKYGNTLISFPAKKGGSYSIPADVTAVADYAFSGCTALQEITFSGSMLYGIGEHAFLNSNTALTIVFNGLKYKHLNSWYSDDSFEVIGHTDDAAVSYTIIDAINGIDVTGISYNALNGCTNLQTLTIGENVTTIPADVFKDCSGLQTLVFKNTKLDVQNLSFNFTQSQVNPALCIIIDGVKYYHKGEWSDANHYFAVGNGSNGSGFDAATASGNQLKVLAKVCKANVTTISNNAFYSVAARYSISLPSSITTISNASFIRNMLTAINVDSDNQTYKSTDGVLFSKDGKTLVSFPSNKGNTYSIPDGVTTIGGDAFNAHFDMTSVTIPASVTTIGQSAFHYTGGNTSLTVTFSGTSQLKTIEKSAFQHSGLSSITLPQGITTIGAQAFRNCQKLQSINLPSSLTSIGSEAFNLCKDLQSVTFANSYSNLTIGGSAFYNCKLANTIILPNGVTTIGGNAFNRSDDFSSQLAIIKLPASAEFSSDIVNSYVKIYRKVNMIFSGNWSTYYSNINLALPTGWKAYTVTGVSGNNVITTELHYIHQQKAVLLQLGSMPADDYFEVPSNATIDLDKNVQFKPELFIGTSKPINNFSSLQGDKYVLTDDGNFVKSNQGTLPAFRCYIKLNSNNNTTLYVKDSNADPNTFIFFEEGTQIDTSKKNLGSVSISSGTLTVTPANGYYINQSDITVKRNVSAGNGRAQLVNPDLVLTKTSGDDPSATQTYTFTTTAGSTYEVSVNFHKRKSLSDNNIERDIVFTDTGYVYDGEAKTPEISAVMFDGSVVNSKNYTVSYTNNINAGSATIVVTGKHEFMNAYSKTFNIAQRNINEVKVKEITDQTYTGAAVKPTIVVTDIVKINDSDVDIINKVSGKPDYELEFSDNINVGVAKVNIKALSNNYTGVKTGTTFNILPKNLSLEANKPTIAAVEDQFYTGSAIEPKLDIKDGTIQLTADEDYTVEYSNNIVEGTATIDISFKGNYTGKAQTTFNIKFKEETLTLSNLQFAENCSWTTYYSPIDVKEVTGVKIFVVTGNKNKNGLDLTTQEIPFIPKNVPLLLQHTDASVKTFTGKTMSSSTKLEGVTPDLDLFRGTASDLDLSTIDGVKFILLNDKFVQAIEGTLTGNHCYVHLNAEDATDLIIVDDKMAEVVIKEEGKDSPKSGTVTVSSSADDEGYKTITVKPSDKLYATKDEIMVLRYMVAGGAASRRVPAVDNTPVEVQPLSEQADPSKETKYKFKYDSQYKYQIVVNFKKRINLSEQANIIVVTLKAEEIQNLVYDGKEKKPTVESVTCNGTKVDPSNFDITYENNINAGKPKVIITGKGIYMGSKPEEFSIGKRNFDYVTVKEPIPDHAYTGSPVEPVYLVLEDIVDGKNIASVSDCIFVCENNVEIGTATFSILPTNNYYGSGKGPFTFNIVAGTAIEKISVEELEEGQWFTLSGHPLVNKPTQKGVYIFRDKNRKAMKIRIK